MTDAPPIDTHPATFTADPDRVRDDLRAIEVDLNDLFPERRLAIRALLLAIICGEHVFMLGEPGTGKSALIRVFFSRFVGAAFFEALLSQSRPVEAILGPIDIPKYKNLGYYVRRVLGYLPTAAVALLDEIGKMSEVLGHDLLTMLNERLLHQVDESGRSAHKVPLRTVAGGSNELPTLESEDAQALWDRLVVRVEVHSIKDRANWIRMLITDIWRPGPTIDYTDFTWVADNVVANIPVPRDVLENLANLREAMFAAHLTTSGRRDKQLLKLLRAQAFLAGRDVVDSEDMEILEFALWNTPEEVTEVRKIIARLSSPLGEWSLQQTEAADELIRDSNAAVGKPEAERNKIGADTNAKFETIKREIAAKRQEVLRNGGSTARIDEVNAHVQSLWRQNVVQLLGFEPA